MISYNTFNSNVVAERLDELLELKPDLLAFQECSMGLIEALGRVPDLYAVQYYNLCTASRWPIASVDSMPRADAMRTNAAGMGGAALVVRLLIDSPYGPFVFTNVHLETARKGLEGLTGGGGLVPDNIAGLERVVRGAARESRAAQSTLSINTRVRDTESARASRYAVRGDSTVPVLVTGDFNLPVESTIFEKHWGHFTDAFEAVGNGFGFTKQEGRLLRVRIDHVLGNNAAPKPVGIWLGPDLGSDHLPVVADFKLTLPRTRKED